MKRKIGWAILLIIVSIVAIYWPLISYGVRQGIGQLQIVIKARPTTEFLQDPTFPDSLKAKLRLIEEVRQYAIDSLGLKDTENYKKLYDQKNEEIMWVVQACEPYELKPKEWHFPIVGSVPYKGFFDKDRALQLRKELEGEGYDVSVRNPGGWSTLGWFNDPILSGMLDRSEGDLASLIIHEMVHATIFIKDNVDFNENLADFIGDTAAYHFLKHRYGLHSKPYDDYLHSDQDYRKYTKHILRGTRSLDSLYQSMKGDSVQAKKVKKEKMITQIVNTIDTLHLYHPRQTSSGKRRLPNNTFFMSYRLYKAKQGAFEKELNEQFGGNLRAYIIHLSEKHPFL